MLVLLYGFIYIFFSIIKNVCFEQFTQRSPVSITSTFQSIFVLRLRTCIQFLFFFIQLICNRYNTHLPIIETVEEKAIIDAIVSNHESMCPKYLLILFISLPFNFTSLYSIFLSVVVQFGWTPRTETMKGYLFGRLPTKL